MRRLSDIPTDVLERALALVRIAEDLGTDALGEMFGPWITSAPEDASRVMAVLAALADKDAPTKEAHAAYGRGDRTPLIVEMERRYQRNRKHRERTYRGAQT